MGNRVPRVKTYVGEAEMEKAISDGWQELFGTAPTKEQVAMIMTQNALETGHRKSMWNYNLGNLTTSGGHDYFDDLTTSEQTSPGVWEKKNLKYMAFPTLREGVLGFLKFLSTNKRYREAWQHIWNSTGDIEEYSKALKRGGYYTANEKQYTAGLKNTYKRYSKNDISSKQLDATEPSNNDVMRQYMQKQKGRESDIFTQLFGPSADATKPNAPEGIESLLNNFLSQVRASEKQNKKLYKKLLPHQHIVIQAYSRDPVDALEFSRVLCTALDEELLARAYTHSDGKHIEIECDICGPEEECFNAVSELTTAVADAFKQATTKIGKVDIKTNLIRNKKSSYQEITNKTAELNYRKFLFKFA